MRTSWSGPLTALLTTVRRTAEAPLLGRAADNAAAQLAQRRTTDLDTARTLRDLRQLAAVSAAPVTSSTSPGRPACTPSPRRSSVPGRS